MGRVEASNNREDVIHGDQVFSVDLISSGEPFVDFLQRPLVINPSALSVLLWEANS